MNNFEPYIEKRPWGEFHQFTKDLQSTVKILFINKGESLSLQKHHKRDEFWRVLRGELDISIGDKAVRAQKGEEFEIPREVYHRAVATISSDAEILEISRGEFDEADVIRKEDKYGRA